MSRTIRLHYQNDYKLVDLPKIFQEFREICGKEFGFQYDSKAVKYYFITYFDDDKVEITKENYSGFSVDSLLEILIETDFPLKVEDAIDGDDVDMYSSKLIDDKKHYFDQKGFISIQIQNNGTAPWPLPLSLCPLQNSTVFSSDYPIRNKVYPKEIVTINIYLIEIKSKLPGSYVLNMQLKKNKISFGQIIKLHFVKA